MKRRSVMVLLGALSFGATIPWRALASLLQSGSAERTAQTLAAVADTLFPGGDGLPGASAFGLHNGVLETPDIQDLITKGVAWLDKFAAAHNAVNFPALDETQRLAALDAAFASTEDGIQQFVLALRYHIGTAYYSQPAVKSTFPYTGPPQPDGFPDFQERPA